MKLSPAARDISGIIRKYSLTYDQFRSAAHAARKKEGLKLSSRSRRLPKILTEEELKRYYDTVDRSDNLGHQIMLRILIFTGVRVSELCAIKIEDINFQTRQIFIEQGKGAKDRHILFPDTFRLPLKAYVDSHTAHTYLFESRHNKPYSTRRIEQIVKEYAEIAKIEKKVHPHLMRHQLLTFLTAKGVPDAQIQLISGHASKAALEKYQHLSLAQVSPNYQTAMKSLPIE